MIGPAEDDPFVGNVGFTNGSGEVVFSDPSLTGSTTTEIRVLNSVEIKQPRDRSGIVETDRV